MNTVHLIDCMNFMKDLPDKHYDLAIVDPPYVVGADDGNFGRGGKGKKGPDGKKRSPSPYRTDLKKYHSVLPGKDYFEELFRISKNQIIWGANYYPQYLCHSGAIVWNKHTTGPLSDAEIAFQSLSKLVTIFDFKYCGFAKKKGSFEDCLTRIIHPNQKPLLLYKWLLTNYAKPGWTIFDSHVGSGSLRIACHDLGFDFEGCEIDADYHKAQEERYQNHIKQDELFEMPEIQELVYKQVEL